MAKRKVDIKIQAYDKASRAFRSAGKGAARFGKTMRGVGKRVMSMQGLLGVGLAMLGKKAITAFNTQEEAVAKLGQVLKATGQAAGYNKQQMLDMASALQKVTTYGDEVIINAQAILATFKNIGGDVFPDAIESILDMSHTLGTDLKSSAISLGKALNDPILGISALSRVGITFTEQQKRQIRVLAESGRVMEAQKIILAELKSEFGGVARAAAKTFGGQYQQLLNSLGDSFEILGAKMAGAFNEAGKKQRSFMQGLTESLDALNEFKKLEMEGEARRKRLGIKEPEKSFSKKGWDVITNWWGKGMDEAGERWAEWLVDVAGQTEAGNRETKKFCESMDLLVKKFKKGTLSLAEYRKQLADLAVAYGASPYDYGKGQSAKELTDKNERSDALWNAFYRWQDENIDPGARRIGDFARWSDSSLAPRLKEGFQNAQQAFFDSLRNLGQNIQKASEDASQFFVRERFGKSLADAETNLIRQRAAAGNKEAQFKLEQLRIEEELAASRRKMTEIIASEVATEQQKLLAKQKLSELEQAEAARVESVRKNIFDADVPRSLAAVESRFLTTAPGHYDPFKDLRKDNRQMIKNTERTAKATETTAALTAGDGIDLAVIKF